MLVWNTVAMARLFGTTAVETLIHDRIPPLIHGEFPSKIGLASEPTTPGESSLRLLQSLTLAGYSQRLVGFDYQLSCQR